MSFWCIGTWAAFGRQIKSAFKTLISVQAILADRGGASVYTGHATGALVLPAIVCECGAGDESPPFSGNFNLTCDIIVISSSDPLEAATLTAHRSRQAFTFDVLMTESADCRMPSPVQSSLTTLLTRVM